MNIKRNDHSLFHHSRRPSSSVSTASSEPKQSNTSSTQSTTTSPQKSSGNKSPFSAYLKSFNDPSIYSNIYFYESSLDVPGTTVSAMIKGITQKIADAASNQESANFISSLHKLNTWGKIKKWTPRIAKIILNPFKLLFISCAIVQTAIMATFNLLPKRVATSLPIRVARKIIMFPLVLVTSLMKPLVLIENSKVGRAVKGFFAKARAYLTAPSRKYLSGLKTSFEKILTWDAAQLKDATTTSIARTLNLIQRKTDSLPEGENCRAIIDSGMKAKNHLAGLKESIFNKSRAQIPADSKAEVSDPNVKSIAH